MSEFALGYDKIAPATWAYLSSLLMIGLYFKFNRFWSVRNVDLCLLILLAPGLLMIQHGHDHADRLQTKLAAISQVEAEGTSPTNSDSDDSGDATGSDVIDPPADGNPRQSDDADPSIGGNDDTPGSDPASQDDSATGDDSTDDNASDNDVADGDETGSTAGATGDAGRELTDEERQLISRIERLRRHERNGYILVFFASLMLMARALADSLMVRRPLLEPNLTSPGLTFIGCSLLVFLVANVVTGATSDEDLFGPQSARQMVQGHGGEVTLDQYKMHGPGYPLLNLLPVIPTAVNVDEPVATIDDQGDRRSDATISKMMAVFSQFAIVIGLVVIGHRHFNNFGMGVGAATLYLMLPYTAQMTGRVTHALPAALLVWAIVSYRRPLWAGCFLGLAMGTVYYPLFLIPLWVSFYWRRGLVRFSVGMALMVLLLGVVLAFTATSVNDYLVRLSAMFGIWSPQTTGLQGIWALGWDSVYRLPILAAFVALSVTYAFWPAQKNFGSLLSCSCAVMIAVQFWHGFGGGLYMAWYLPLLLLTIFRPNLEDRVALAVLDEGRLGFLKRPKSHSPRSAAA